MINMENEMRNLSCFIWVSVHATNRCVRNCLRSVFRCVFPSKMRFTISPKSVFLNYELTDVAGVQDLIPSQDMILTPIKLFKSDTRARHWMSFNIYQVQIGNFSKETRLEVNLWVTFHGKLRCLVLESYSSTPSFQWDTLFYPATPGLLFENQRLNRRIKISMDNADNFISYSEEKRTISSDVIKANEAVLYRCGYLDSLVMNDEFKDPDIRLSHVQFTDQNTLYSHLRSAVPIVFYYENALDIRLNPGKTT